ncbi:forkhead box protein P2 [Oreochromis niloticus]|uniref:forkhead box protein P2 n=1 Tax=Oreochromis niloticus TaxID=8128 RepID=UPI000674CB37|nr:forkhead box protein P2 [Oreochromis niloticus]CAI5665414.1 unnamed protein product [Mustela putorius furo]
MPESPLSPTTARQNPASSLLSHTDSSGGERVANGNAGTLSGDDWQTLQHKQVFLAMMAPQQMQQFLAPNQLQALIHQKQQALLLQQHHLKEFYKKQQQQIQLLQQQSSKKIKELSSPQLVFQQLIQLQQQQQQQLLRAHRPALSSPALSPACLSPAEMQQVWKELTLAMTEDKTAIKANRESSTGKIMSAKVPGRQADDQQSACPHRAESTVKGDHAAKHALFGHGVCNWPGCESVCENFSQFIKHISSEHSLDDRSTAQCRVQMQVVQQLELQLCKERERLQAMMAHLHLPSLEAQSLSAPAQSPQSDAAADPCGLQLTSVNSLPSLNSSDPAQVSPRPLDPVGTPSQRGEKEFPSHTSGVGPMRRRNHPLVYSLSSENEYELYKNTDLRPPFTYATLIRQAIMEASDMQLTLNDIYNWFTRTFAYFRRNAATWKNAVRHNLSLHKCFVRVENVKGAVWTVDEVEYQRRRSQKITGNPSLMKSISSSAGFGTLMNSGLQTALAEASLPGLKKDNVRGNSKSQIQKSSMADSHRNQNFSPRVQPPLFLEDKELKMNDQGCLIQTVKPVSLQPDMSENDEGHLFDLE